jgi:hypothetical protein
LCSLVGGVVPFAPTLEERETKHDPRLSVAERYTTPTAYVEKVDKVAQALVREHLMLAEDLPRQHDAAAADTLAGLHPPQSKGAARETR